MYDAPVDPRISIITLGVSDLERSTRFYCDGLGLPLREPRDEGISFFPAKGQGTSAADPPGFLWEVAWNPHFWIE